MISANKNYAEAMFLVFQGKKMARKSWENPCRCIYAQNGSKVKTENLKNEPMEALKALRVDTLHTEVEIKLHIDMLYSTGEIFCGWSPIQEDLLADDWFIVE